MLKCVLANENPIEIQEFLEFPSRIYSKREYIENTKEVESILLKTHALSKYFKCDAFVITDDDITVARFILTRYPKDTTLYIGFFESINDNKVAKFLFNNVNAYAKQHKFNNIVGPVDASFWIKYRLKINKFQKPYTGEPYNKDYYLKLFEDNGYKVNNHYSSNIYDVVDDSYVNKKFQERYQQFTKNGYEIKNITKDTYDRSMSEIYYLLTELYNDFPIYKHIDKADFMEMFKDYKKILNFDMVKIAYYNQEAIGFFISVPNYSTITNHLNLINILKLLKIKRNPKEYIMLYMGVLPNHKGMGNALANSITEELKKKKLPSIGALIKDGKVTRNYASDLVSDRYEYVLLEKIVNYSAIELQSFPAHIS